MNKDQFKGALIEFAGKVQEGLGKLAGSLDLQDRGVDLQYKGRVQVHLGDLKDFEESEIHDRAYDKRRAAWVNGRGR